MIDSLLHPPPLSHDAARNYWEANSFKYDCLHDRLRLVAREITKLSPRSVLDLGCSTGRLADELQVRLPRLRYYGCDVSQAAVERINRPHVVQCDLNVDGLPFGDLCFGCVAASGICEYIANLPGFLDEVTRRLNPRGWLVASYFNTRHVKRLLRTLAGRPPARNPCWQELVSPAQFERLLHRAGFTIERRLAARGRIRNSRPAEQLGVADRWQRTWPRIAPLAHLLAHQLVYVCRRRP